LQKPSKIILGIDPGTVIMGYSVIRISNNIIEVLEIDVLKLPVKKDNYHRLQLIHQQVTKLVRQYKPGHLAIEAPFFGKNVQSMLKLGRAQGVAIAAAMNEHVPVSEYSPKRVKQSITGNGNADKEQIWKMLLNLVAIPDKPKFFDATDALAVAICHHFSDGALKGADKPRGKKSNGWGKFLSENPERIL
jgi:crossover junction endodeoxyribonuclease RuvC